MTGLCYFGRPSTSGQSSDGVDVDDFLRQLRGVCECSALEFAVRVGRLVIHTFYEGRLDRWQSRGKHHPSLRLLASRQDMPISTAQLYRCVAIYEASMDLPELSTWKHVGASHLRAVLRLNRTDRKRLLSFAETEQWSVHRLEHEVHAIEPDARSRRGRPPISHRTRQLMSVKRWLEDCPDSIDSIEPHAMDLQTRMTLHSRVLKARERCDEIERTLQLHDSR